MVFPEAVRKQLWARENRVILQRLSDRAADAVVFMHRAKSGCRIRCRIKNTTRMICGYTISYGWYSVGYRIWFGMGLFLEKIEVREVI